MENNKPETKIKIGAISASVWKRMHTGKDGKQFERRQVSIDRVYKDKDGSFKNANSFELNDIPKAILALQESYALLAKHNGAPTTEAPFISFEDVK